MRSITEIYESGALFDGHYKLIDLLSTSGGSADVWLAIDMNTIDGESDETQATKVVIKVYRPKNIIDIEGEYQFRNEFKKVFNCHHENIIQPTYFSIFEEMPYLVLPYCPTGSSELLIGQINGKEHLWKYIYEVASGIAYLHEHSPRIIHQDIKPANVLIDDNGNYAITDFGISAEMGGTDTEAKDESGGTFAYMAPERFLENTQPMSESDIWAFGATLFEIITGDVPFGNDGGAIQRQNTPIPVIKQDIPDAIKQLVYSCLAFEPSKRPTARSIVDTVLKKRYSKSKKSILTFTIAGIVLVTGLTAILTLCHGANQEEQFNVLVERGDSIISAQTLLLKDIDYIPSMDNAAELEKARLIYSDIRKDAPAEYVEAQEIQPRLTIVDSLINEIGEYDRARYLAETAQEAEMKEEYIECALLRDNQRTKINQLIDKLK